MAQQEGVIKFQLEHTQTATLNEKFLTELNFWRDWMYTHNLIGVIDTPQGKVGYGNISCRLAEGFAITGSQTGHLKSLTTAQYALVTACYPEENLVISQGPIKPSSESLTHAVIYQLDDKINWVMHAHHSALWQSAEELGLPMTFPDVPYGTPEMAAETRRLFSETNVCESRIFAMSGHQDGIVSFGFSADQAAEAIRRSLDLIQP